MLAELNDYAEIEQIKLETPEKLYLDVRIGFRFWQVRIWVLSAPKLILITSWLIKLYDQVSKKSLLLGKVKGKKEPPPKSKVVGVFILSSVAWVKNLPPLPKFILSLAINHLKLTFYLCDFSGEVNEGFHLKNRNHNNKSLVDTCIRLGKTNEICSWKGELLQKKHKEEIATHCKC